MNLSINPNQEAQSVIRVMIKIHIQQEPFCSTFSSINIIFFQSEYNIQLFQKKKHMYNQTIFYQPLTNQNLSTFYANCMAYQQKMTQNSIYQNSINFNYIISYAVSMDFKNFQTKILLQQMQNNLFSDQPIQNQTPQKLPQQLTVENQQKNEKNLNFETDKVDKLETIQFSDLYEKSEKEESKSKAITLDESQEKVEFEICSIKENKNTDKKFKKTLKSDKSKEFPLIDLVDFAQIKKDSFSRSQIQKIKDNLLSRQVQNWNEIQKSRRNEKLQLRRIKY